MFVAIACIGAQFPVSAATFTTERPSPFIRMTGEITLGDAERLAAIFVAVKPYFSDVYIYPNTLYLSSPGGDVSEAIRIANLVRTLGISVVTTDDGVGVCASSCFLIYASALHREATGIDTLMAEGRKGNFSPLGVHRPYSRLHSEGPAAEQRQEQVMSDMRAYLVKANVGHFLIDKMMSHASNDIYWLNAEDVRALREYSPGVEEQLIAGCGYNARRESNLGTLAWVQSTKSGVLKCVSDYMSNTYEPLKNTAVDRMRKGWRPRLRTT